MSKEIHRLDIADPLLKEKLETIKRQLIAQAPEHIKKLGKILRRRSVFSLHRYLVELGYAGKIDRTDLPLFMDWLITQRIDLPDMHEEARRRLREHTLRDQPLECKTDDYKKFVEELKEPVRCRDCQWFTSEPSEGSKSCVELGHAKGEDFPCYGFIMKRLA